ncbi:MAG: Gfo/Idh/MocA family oxidoreductase [Acidobacteriota bacterium]
MNLHETTKSNHPPRRAFIGALGSAAAAASLSASQAQQAAAGKRIGVGLIGCGGRGSYLGRLTQQLGQQGEPVELVAVCDVYRPRLERAAKKYSVKPYGDASELVRDPNVDAVIVAAPDRLHAFHSLMAVRSGKAVYSEKPTCHWQQFDKLKELVQEVRRTGMIFQMGTQRLADKIWRQAAEVIRRGDIGKPVHVQMGYFRRGDSGERGMPVDDPNARPGPDLNWDAFLADAPSRPFTPSRFFQWRMYMDYSGGPCTDNDVHFLALMIKALGVKFPKHVVALGGKYIYNGEREVPDTFDMIFEYPEGLNLTFLGTYGNDHGLDTVVRGTEATLRFGDSDAEVEPLQGSTKRRRTLARFDVNVEHLRDFFQCVQTKQKPQGDIDLAYYTQVALIMAMRSFVERKVATFDPANERIELI